MKILIIGQCTLHWGRMEFGNIGNYYIIEPFVRELKINFPNCEISTTLQMSSGFCKREDINVLPMDLYYSWSENELINAKNELRIANDFFKEGVLNETTPYINEVLQSDLVIDFSGDIWGDNADFLGEDRFYIGLCKDRVAQLLGKKTIMLAGSPGPFSSNNNLDFAKEVFKGFNFVTNRESLSRDILENNNFDVSNLHDLACPAFLFDPKIIFDIDAFLEGEGLIKTKKPIVGFVLCGWNFVKGPFDKWPICDDEYTVFAEAIEYLEALGAKVCLMSHSNGFIPKKKPFELLHGRDYPVAKQLQGVIQKRGIAKDVCVLDGVYDAWTTKAIIGNFDMLVSGRIHAAVSALSQSVPTVIIDYGHAPKAHKLRGFAIEVGVLNYVADPADNLDLISKINACWERRFEYKKELDIQIPKTKLKAKANFTLIKKLFN